MVSNYLISEGKSVYRPSKQMIALRKTLSYQVSHVMRKLLKEKKIVKYSGKTYKVLDHKI